MAHSSAAPSRAEIEKAKLLYDAGVEPVSKLRAMLGMSDRAFRAFRVENGWPMRASPIKRSAPAASEPMKKPSRGLIARLEEAVEREFARAETALHKGGPKSVEQSARVLASLVRSLAELKRMSRDAGFPPGGGEDEEDAHGPDQPPRELAELREELGRRLERLSGGGEAR